MMKREALNVEHYQHSVEFAEQFSEIERQEFLRESEGRYQFEQRLTQPNLANNRFNRPLVWVSGCLFVVFIIAVTFYWQTNRYEQVLQGKQALELFLTQKENEDNNQRNDHYIVNLQTKLRADPNNGELWFELGQAYSLNNEFESAMICFNNAVSVLGRKAAIIGAMATADYYQNKQRFSERAREWIDEALTADAKESASLLLLASDAFLHNEFKQAITYWERVLESDNKSVNRREVIQSIQIAEQMLASQSEQKR